MSQYDNANESNIKTHTPFENPQHYNTVKKDKLVKINKHLSQTVMYGASCVTLAYKAQGNNTKLFMSVQNMLLQQISGQQNLHCLLLLKGNDS